MASIQLQSALAEQEVVATGRFASMTHGQLRKLVLSHDGCWAPQVTRRTRILAVGQDGPPLDRCGRWTKNLERAVQLRGVGQSLEILTEQQLLDRLNVADACSRSQQQYSIAELSELLEVSGRILRSWLAAGLIQPCEHRAGVPCFDYSQAAAARKLCQLMASGVPIRSIKGALRQVRKWLPHDTGLLGCLANCASERTLLLRRADGRLTEPGGQLVFDFEESAAPAVALPPQQVTVEDLFEEAYALEAAGRLTKSAALYQKAIEHEPDDPVLHFNLGNVYYSMGRIDSSIRCYQSAVDHDPSYAEAWNNLGNAFGRAGQGYQALTALRQAVACNPNYADGHFNLAETCSEQGHSDEARFHWRKCLDVCKDPALSDAALAALKKSLRLGV